MLRAIEAHVTQLIHAHIRHVQWRSRGEL